MKEVHIWHNSLELKSLLFFLMKPSIKIFKNIITLLSLSLLKKLMLFTFKILLTGLEKLLWPLIWDITLKSRSLI